MENTVNERVRLLRTHLGLTQNDFAIQVNSTLATISRTETGGTTPQQKLLNKIIEVFSVNRDWILHGTGEMFSENQTPAVIKTTNWKEEAYTVLKNHNEDLKKEVEWLRGLLSKTVGSPNFLNGIDLAMGFKNPINTVSAAA